MKRTALYILMTFVCATITVMDARAGHNDGGNIIVMPVEAADESLLAGADVLQEIIKEYFNNNHTVTVISEEQKEAMSGDETGNRVEMIKKVTGRMNSNRALVVTLKRYRERVGDEYSVEDPASLAFDFKLVRIDNGQAICSGRFDETQEPLTENILKLGQAIKRGFKWVTVKKMATDAVDKKFAECPPLQYIPGE